MNVGKIYQLPINEETAYIAGVIVGDGHISNTHKANLTKSKDYKIAIEVIDLGFLKKVETSIKSVIQTKSTIKKRPKNRGNRKSLYYFNFRNKSFYYFLTDTLGIPAGRKCSSVRIPQKIFICMSLQKHFIAGLFDTDGGIRGNTIGFTSASKLLMDDVGMILKNWGFRFYSEKWLNQKYQRNYYGIKIYKRDSDRFLKYLPLKNKEKLEKVFRHVDVPEWSNGLDNSLMKIKS